MEETSSIGSRTGSWCLSMLASAGSTGSPEPDAIEDRSAGTEVEAVGATIVWLRLPRFRTTGSLLGLVNVWFAFADVDARVDESEGAG